MTDKDLQNLTASVICSQLLLHYLEEIKHTPYYKGKLKESTRSNIIQLMKVERKEFDKLSESDGDVPHQISSNLIEVISLMLSGGFSNLILLGNLQYAYHKNPKAIEGIVNKVLKE